MGLSDAVPADLFDIMFVRNSGRKHVGRGLMYANGTLDDFNPLLNSLGRRRNRISDTVLAISIDVQSKRYCTIALISNLLLD